MAAVERIYIGGLDPPRLSPRDILRRLERLDTIEIVESIIPSVEEKPFFHLVVRPNAKEEEGGEQSALEIISKLYNNVVWKGCRMKVQAAQPSFLDRLAEEIKLRQESSQSRSRQPSSDTELIENNNNRDEKETSLFTKRRLRIRRKYGDEAFHVDTKPVEVEKWSDFRRALEKTQTRRDRHFSKTKADPSADQSTSFLNRSIHIRFDDDEGHEHGFAPPEAATGIQAEEPTTETKGTEVTDLMSEEDDDDSSSSSSSNNSDSGDEQQGIGTDTSKQPGVSLLDGYSDSDDDSMSKQKTNNREEEELPSKESSVNEGGYQWSSSDESSSSSDMDNDDDDEADNMFLKSRNKPFKTASNAGTGEFDAGMPLDDIDNDWGATFDSNMAVNTGGDEENQDISNDISANLDVLSSIFPEMQTTTPKLIQKGSQDGDGCDNENSGDFTKDSAVSSSGWGAGGLMLRYDPTKESAQKFEVRSTDDKPSDEREEIESAESHDSTDSKSEVETDENDSSANEKRDAVDTKVEENGSDDSGEDMGENEVPSEVPAEEVYQQGKLEDVFNNARTSRLGGGLSTLTESDAAAASGTTSSGGGGAFSFGFDLGPSEEQKTPQTSLSPSGGFSFGFDLGSDKPPSSSNENETTMYAKSGTNEEPSPQDVSMLSSAHHDTSGEDKPVPLPERSGLGFPQHVLDDYQRLFMTIHDGDRIMNDLEGYHNDEQVKQKWLKERNTLTLDWKRKRKYAQTRIAKRKKFK